MNEEKERLLIRRVEIQKRSIVEEKLTIGGVYHLIKELGEINEKIAELTGENKNGK